jgi:hypothetical protein
MIEAYFLQIETIIQAFSEYTLYFVNKENLQYESRLYSLVTS